MLGFSGRKGDGLLHLTHGRILFPNFSLPIASYTTCNIPQEEKKKKTESIQSCASP